MAASEEVASPQEVAAPKEVVGPEEVAAPKEVVGPEEVAAPKEVVGPEEVARLEVELEEPSLPIQFFVKSSRSFFSLLKSLVLSLLNIVFNLNMPSNFLFFILYTLSEFFSFRESKPPNIWLLILR